MDETPGKAIPHGSYDTSANEGRVTVGYNNDTSEFAVNSLRYWWKNMSEARYPNAHNLLLLSHFRIRVQSASPRKHNSSNRVV